MSLEYRSRAMRAQDVGECAKIVATHPVIGPRYGKAIADLKPAWLRLLKSEGQVAAVLEEIEGTRTTICMVGVSVFVGDDFLRELKSPPLRWLGPELAKRILRGDSPLLSGKQVRDANSGEGMNLVVWEGCIRPGFEHKGEIHRRLLDLFLDLHRGYIWKEVISQHMESVERLEWTLQTGGRLWNAAAGRYVESMKKDPRDIINEPHYAGATREMERERPGTWVGALFDYHPPQMGLSPSEQRLATLALCGKTDDELAEELGASLSTVKNTWRSIFNRAASRLPEIFTTLAEEVLNATGRGKEKRRPLLAYLREHPEELRPVSRRLMEQGDGRRGASAQSQYGPA
jgi:hypothetical protein